MGTWEMEEENSLVGQIAGAKAEAMHAKDSWKRISRQLVSTLKLLDEANSKIKSQEE